MGGIILSERSWQRLKPLIEQPLNAENVYDDTVDRPANWQHIRVTGAALDCDGSGSGAGIGSGSTGIRYYPAVVEGWDAEDESPTEYGTCLLIERHEYPLVIGNVYVGKQTGNKIACGTAYSVFVTAIPIAGLEECGCAGGSGSGSGGGIDASGESDACGSITIPFAACDLDGFPCTKELVITLGTKAAWCITDPNGCD